MKPARSPERRRPETEKLKPVKTSMGPKDNSTGIVPKYVVAGLCRKEKDIGEGISPIATIARTMNMENSKTSQLHTFWSVVDFGLPPIPPVPHILVRPTALQHHFCYPRLAASEQQQFRGPFNSSSTEKRLWLLAVISYWNAKIYMRRIPERFPSSRG